MSFLFEEVNKTASEMLERHGEFAQIEAMKLLIQCEEKEDIKGREKWLLIADAIVDIQNIQDISGSKS